MNRIKSTMTVFGMLIISAKCFSQVTDSIPKKAEDSLSIRKRVVAFAADKFAIARPLNFEFSNTAPYHYKSKKQDNISPGGEVTSFQQVKLSANINLIKKKTWLLSTTMGYRFTSVATDVTKTGTTDQITMDNDFYYLFSSLNLSYFSSLFGKRVIYNSSVVVDGSDKHFERVKGLFAGVMVLKANQKTKMTAGFMVNIDPGAVTPFIPIFSYEHKFNNGLIADIFLPRSIQLRKFVFNSGRISLGTELDGTSFYLYNLDGTSQKYEYRQLDINSGLTYEHVIAKHFMLTAKSGVKVTPTGRIFKKEEAFQKPVYQVTPDPAFYFNIGISFNPFSLLGKKN
ncbi:hypothetical protein FBD94_20425 [Pedobacter hiemivivus]|uniref:DUF6268 domain-containing protein n=1 Tax=Pedobacter hiemivivus TaxID=2530454 RepID=A0A4U1G5A2_9SPHI|nr:hypothetical protein [Pedobacter hiemivivus]TKC57643.1 hypothetical protein FBD94_20425 [Pedobacter hiemivivus]